MWSPLIEACSGNLALLHCSCLHACLAVYSNILRRDLITTCIIINRGVWRHGRGPISERSNSMEAFDANVEIKTTWEMVSTYEVLWSARLNTNKEAGNQQDRSSQREATKTSMGFWQQGWSAPRDRYQRWWMAIVQHLICVNIRRMGLDGKDRNGDRHRNTSITVEVVWRQKPTKLWALSCLHSLACET